MTLKKNNRLFGLAVVLWIAVIALSLFLNWQEVERTSFSLALTEARANLTKDLIYRRWATLHGGVYVPVTDNTPPNPYLAKIPERDVVTPAGKRLTLINPAYMIRQVHELGQKAYRVKGHLTSLKPIRPENAADAWETQALLAFREGDDEVSSVEIMAGNPYLRFMQPIVVENGCLKCHDEMGQKKEDIQGGISVSVPFIPYLDIAAKQQRIILLSHLVIGFLGLAGFWFGRRFVSRSHIALRKSEQRLQRRMEFEQLVSQISSELARSNGSSSIDATINSTLGAIGAFTGADRAYVFQYQSDGARMDNTHEWCAEGVEPQIEKLKNILMEEEQPWITRRLLDRETFHIPDVSALPPEAWRERDLLVDQDIQSLIVVPMELSGELKGFLGLDDVRRHRTWHKDDQSLLRFVGETISHVLERSLTMKEQENLQTKMITAIELAHLGHWEYDVANDIFTFNDHFYKMFRTNVEQVGGYTMSSAEYAERFVHPEDLPMVGAEIRKSIETTDPDFSRQLEHRILFADGEVGHISVRFFIQKDANGRTVKTFGVNQDITPRKKAEAENEKLQARLQQAQKLESIGTLAGGIAHDFNNILSPIVGLSELLLEDLPSDITMHQDVQEILKAGKRGRDLVRQILAFSRQSEHHKMPVRIQDILKEVFKLTRSTIPANIEIAHNIQSDCGPVMADPTQVHQIAMNLITNAYHAVEARQGKISIGLKETFLESDDVADSTLEPGPYAVLTISDTGCGIDTAILDKIFDPYFTTKEKGKGTGLGLALVYGIIKEHRGEIKVYSEIGEGTRFDVYLPLEEKSDAPLSFKPIEACKTGSEHILLVDDEESIANLEKLMLERLGYQVTSRVSSPEALGAFKARPDAFDLVISDMTMPNMTGDQLAKELIATRPDIPIIICTGFSERINADKAAAMGVKALLMKPVVRAELSEVVRAVLDTAQGVCYQSNH